MADPTVSVTAGSTDVVGVGTSFIERGGDLFILAGLTVPIAYSTPGRLTLARPWPGATLAERSDFATQRSGPYWSSAITTNVQLNDLLSKLDAALPLKFDAAGPFTQRASLDNQPAGFVFLSVDPAPFTLYVKLANTSSEADWSAGQAVKTTPARNTEESQAAAAAAAAARAVAEEKAAAASSAAATATTSAGVSTAAAATAGAAAGTSTAQAGIATGAAGTATQGATTATAQAGVATTQAAAAMAARQDSQAARDQAVPAAAQAVAANAATQTIAAGVATNAAAALAAAGDARQAAAALGLAAFDFAFDSNPDPTNDWST